MGYGRLSGGKKGLSLVVSLLIHLMITVVLAVSFQHSSEKSSRERFDVYAVKLFDLKPMSKDRQTSKGDKKAKKMVRKKKSNKSFSQKGVRQALPPKTPLESLKRVANNPITKPQSNSSPKLTFQQHQLNKLDKATPMPSVKPLKRLSEWKKKLVHDRPKTLAKLQMPSASRSYTQRLKSINKRRITPLKAASNPKTKVQPQQSVDQLRRTQRFTPITHSAAVKINLAKAQAIPQSERRIQLAKLTPNQPQNKINTRMNYQQKRLTSKPVLITQRQQTYKTWSTPVVRKTAVSPNKSLTEVTQTITEVRRVETITQVVKKSASVSRAISTPMLTSELALEPIPMRIMEKQVKAEPLVDTPQKNQALQTVSYQQKQTQRQSVELTQVRVSYKQQSQMVNRELSGPSSLDVTTPPQLETAQPQSLQALSRQSVSFEPVPQANQAILNPNGISESTPQMEFSDKQVQLVRLESTYEELVVKERVEFEQHSTVTEPTKIIQRRVAYQQGSEVDKKSIDQPAGLTGVTSEVKESVESLATKTPLASISRQEHRLSVPTSADSSILDPQHYTPQGGSTVDYTKARNRIDSSSSALEQRKELAFVYTSKSTDKSRAKLDPSHSPRGADLSQTPSSPLSSLLSNGQAAAGDRDAPVIKAKLPSGNMTQETLYRLNGRIEGDVKQAFVTINEITQLVQVINGEFEVEVAMVKGVNKISILAFDSRGGVGKQTLKLLYSPLPGVPLVRLESPENGKQGVKEGDSVMVLGRIDDSSITQATLYLNSIPIRMKVVNGRFKRKIFLPNSRITTFRVMAKKQNGPPGYSALHTILTGYNIDITNPRPY